MSERKVLQKYIPPDFDPSKLGRNKGPKSDKLPTVRLMTPMSMRCTRCGTFIPKSKKFNARKQTIDGETYLGIQIFRFFFRCPGCSGEVSFKTDPKNMDYKAEAGAVRNFEPWRENHVEETDEERLQRLEAEEQDVDAMKDLEAKMHDAQRDMAVADALDEIRAQNARNERAADFGQVSTVTDTADNDRERQEREDAEAARMAFQRIRQWSALDTLEEEIIEDDSASTTSGTTSLTPTSTVNDVPKTTPPISFKKTVRPKKNFSAALGIKKKVT